MLGLDNLTYRIGARTIIDDASATLMEGWKVGVVGQNGAGKSTLFKLLMGELQPDGGKVTLPAHRRIGQVRQDIPDTDTPLVDMVISAHEELAQLLKDAETETDPYKIGDIHARLAELDAYSARSRAATLLTGLGFNEDQMDAPFSSLSGGWRMRVALASVLFVQPDVLMLDEPTNHLDLEAIMWLEDYLIAYPHTVMIISHDRELLNKCTDHILHVDKGKLTLYTGTYDTFERERTARLGLQQKMHEKQMAHRAHMQSFVDRFRATASKARQAQSRLKALERMDIVDAVIADRATSFSFPQPEKLSPPLMAIQNVDVGYAEGKPIIRKIYETIDMDDRIALLGANGNGKSTLMKLIAGKLGAMKGEVVKSGKLRIGYFAQHQTEELDVNSTPFQEMARLVEKKHGEYKESAVRAILGQFGFSKPLADNTIGTLSGGEKARLLFAFMSYEAPHLLLLDEPTNHLDIEAREALVQALNNYEGAVVLVSHDPGMVERVANRLWLINDQACTLFDGDLDDYRTFVVKARRNARKAERARKNAQNQQAEEKPAVKTASPSTLRHRTAELEKKIDKLSRDKEKLERDMMAANFYADATRARDTQNTYNKIITNMAEAEAEWISLQETLDNVAS